MDGNGDLRYTKENRVDMKALFLGKTLRYRYLTVLTAFSLLLLPACGGGGSGNGNVTDPGGSVIPPQVGGNPPALGVNASLQGARPFPDDNPWNTPIDSDPLDPDSDLLIDSIGRTASLHPDFGADWNGGPFGIP